MKRWIIVAVAILLWIALFIATVGAQETPQVRFSEFNINPEGSDKGKEWIEIENYSNTNISTENIFIVIDNKEYDLGYNEINSESYCVREFNKLTLHNDFGLIELKVGEKYYRYI